MPTTALDAKTIELPLKGSGVKNAQRAEKQEALLKAHSKHGIADVLEKHGIAYDDITYFDGVMARQYKDAGTPEPLKLCPRVMSTPIPVISCFSGGGGFDVGAERAGYKTVLALDIDKNACETLRRNKIADVVMGPPDSSGDLHSISPEDILKAAKAKRPFPGLVVGGPPCQPFSLAANQRFSRDGDNFKRIGFKDKKRGTLLDRFENLLLYVRPAAFIVENVRGLMDIDGGNRIAEFRATMAKAGYQTAEPLILNAADYGVPQYRERLFLVGNRLGREFSLSPMPKTLKKLSAIDVLAALPSDVPNHQPRNHAVASILRYRRLQMGTREQLGRVDRLHPFRPSKTVIAGGTRGGGRSHLHPFVPRTLTVRECARLQTFPDDYVFYGPIARQFTQVGNAIPPLLAYQVAASVYRTIFR